ncbi:MAG: tail fiber protein, partial [Neisseriaceae bacterium]|nr:tail fiber protein [Neisseriaceae bacterium]
MSEIITTITTAGYQASVNNAPDADGFRIKLQYADIYSGSTKKGRFEVKGAKISNNQIRIRAVITSESEEYSYDSVRLIETLSGKAIHFATIKRKDNGVLDFVSPSKKSTFSFNLTFSTISADKITIIQDDGNSLALAELDTHKQASEAHEELFSKKANNTLTLTAGNGLTGGGNLTANRTFALGTPSSITASTTNSVTADSHTHEVDKASTTVAGIVQLYNGVDSSNTARALTAAQGKVLNDKITNAKPVVYTGLD